jgi:hypothetical protein
LCVWAKRLEQGRFVSNWADVATREMDWTGLTLCENFIILACLPIRTPGPGWRPGLSLRPGEAGCMRAVCRRRRGFRYPSAAQGRGDGSRRPDSGHCPGRTSHAILARILFRRHYRQRRLRSILLRPCSIFSSAAQRCLAS